MTCNLPRARARARDHRRRSFRRETKSLMSRDNRPPLTGNEKCRGRLSLFHRRAIPTPMLEMPESRFQKVQSHRSAQSTHVRARVLHIERTIYHYHPRNQIKRCHRHTSFPVDDFHVCVTHVTHADRFHDKLQSRAPRAREREREESDARRRTRATVLRFLTMGRSFRRAETRSDALSRIKHCPSARLIAVASRFLLNAAFMRRLGRSLARSLVCVNTRSAGPTRFAIRPEEWSTVHGPAAQCPRQFLPRVKRLYICIQSRRFPRDGGDGSGIARTAAPCAAVAPSRFAKK